MELKDLLTEIVIKENLGFDVELKGAKERISALVSGGKRILSKLDNVLEGSELAEFNRLHPREAAGRFTSGSGVSSVTASSLREKGDDEIFTAV
jgi:hypothetical protein